MTLNPLKPGDRIALVAPASPFDEERLARVCEALQNRGYHLALGRHITCKKGYLAGSEAERADDLIRAVLDPDSAAIICIRGGYGSGRMLPWLPFSAFRDQRKIFLGYSDITFLHLAFQSRMQWVTFHGPNIMDLADAPERIDAVLGMLSGETEFVWPLSDDQILRHGTGSGPVVGGNLTCLIHLLGTPYFPKLEGRLLFIEDCGEALYRIDRHLTHLKLSGALHQLSGLILGRFTDCGDSQEISQMVVEQAGAFHFPIVANLPFGHGLPNEVLPMGIPFALNTYGHSFEISRSPFGI